ncbi:MAG: heme ABC transporter ATP-binding protein [Planctomycetes bacterium]|nr:heme ABC transporter ATP-binding protein [Planctomycetota bacterium]
MIEVSQLTFSYNLRPVLDGVELTVGRGEFVGLLGPNGSGKTTLLRLLSRVLRPKSGRVCIEGRDLAHMPQAEIARIVAVVPQETALVFPFTVAEVVLMGRSPHLGLLAFEREKDVEIARQAMAQTDTLSFADRYLHELSGGEKQGVIIARALAQEPKILLLDEPTAFLDIKHQISVYELLVRLNRECGLTILAVSHDLNLAAQYCQRLVLLKQGKVFAGGPPAQVVTAENIRQVYEAEVTVEKNPRTGAPWIMPLGLAQRERSATSNERTR